MFIWTFFDCLNATNFGDGIKKKDFQKPYFKPNDEHLSVCSLNKSRLNYMYDCYSGWCLNLCNTWRNGKISSEQKGDEPKDIAQRLLNQETLDGISITGRDINCLTFIILCAHSVVIFGACSLHSQDSWCL